MNKSLLFLQSCWFRHHSWGWLSKNSWMQFIFGSWSFENGAAILFDLRKLIFENDLLFKTPHKGLIYQAVLVLLDNYSWEKSYDIRRVIVLTAYVVAPKRRTLRQVKRFQNKSVVQHKTSCDRYQAQFLSHSETSSHCRYNLCHLCAQQKQYHHNLIPRSKWDHCWLCLYFSIK